MAVFMAKDATLFEAGSSFVHMQIRTADIGGGNTDKHTADSVKIARKG
jgi:hypothetical protein